MSERTFFRLVPGQTGDLGRTRFCGTLHPDSRQFFVMPAGQGLSGQSAGAEKTKAKRKSIARVRFLNHLRLFISFFYCRVENKEAECAARERLGDCDRNLAASVSVTRAG